ncbi:MAG TPA: 3-oxoacyl-[acyl-carrier-protein] synthase III C-terminal domain-containing protein [Gemmatimonadaceae bacterium]|nr:3-oxoacyl-[acyl-carrier-protein] synthase III C-terminal domain-containing protein [Gemmatimonadaceae bacterium]
MTDVGIDAVTYWLPDHAPTLAELEQAGALRGPASTLASFGFERARVAQSESHVDMAVSAVTQLLRETGTSPDEIDLVLYAGALTSSSTMECAPAPAGSVLHMRDFMDFFKYPVSRLQSELDLANAAVAGIDQQGCAAIFSAVRLARATLLAEPDVRTVLCVSADRLPHGSSREVVYNLVSDGACAMLVRRGATQNRIVATHQVTKGAFWDSGSLENEIIAAYFPTARTVIEDTLRKAGITLDDVRWVIPHNVSLRSWEILLGLIGCPREKLFSQNIGRVGHTIAADNFINLRDATDGALIRKGDILLLFTFGYGLNWSCMVLEH